MLLFAVCLHLKLCFLLLPPLKVVFLARCCSQGCVLHPSLFLVCQLACSSQWLQSSAGSLPRGCGLCDVQLGCGVFGVRGLWAAAVEKGGREGEAVGAGVFLSESR